MNWRSRKTILIHREISDSINYASRIRTVLLPDPSALHEYLSDYFILLKPRNVVSGDFYWFSGIDNKVIFCLADCTGHGVPGAFMSMLGISFLREIITREHLYEPSEILNRLRNEVIIALNQRGVQSDQKDGMDISSKPMAEQKEILEKKIEMWRTGFGVEHEQTDDITLVSIEI